MNSLDQTTRAWLYRIALVLIAVLIAIDVVNGGSAQSWVAWIAGAIGLGSAGLATKHTTRKRPEPLGDSDGGSTDEIPTSSP